MKTALRSTKQEQNGLKKRRRTAQKFYYIGTSTNKGRRQAEQINGYTTLLNDRVNSSEPSKHPQNLGV
jgi:hypothetical protein